MRLAYSLALVVVIPFVAVWAALTAMHSALLQGGQMIWDAWQ